MIFAAEIARAAHEICEQELIPKGISPKHDYPSHLFTSEVYAEAINKVNLDTNARSVVQAIIAVTKWGKESPFPGHPHPDLVIDHIRNKT